MPQIAELANAAKPKLGQNFLIDAQAVERIGASLAISPANHGGRDRPRSRSPPGACRAPLMC